MKKASPSFAPRLMTHRQVASYWGVSPNTFKKLTREGTAPGPISAGLGRLLYDREQQDRAIDALSGQVAIADDLDRELAEFINGKG
jgi:hypothetical protein